MADRVLAEARDPERNRSDLTWRWMAHHIAELITRAERGPPEHRAAAAAECREAILALWRHRYCLEVGHRPFEAFVPLAETLAERGDPWARRRPRVPWDADVTDDPLLAVLRDIDAGADAAAELVTSLVAARLNSEETVPDLQRYRLDLTDRGEVVGV